VIILGLSLWLLTSPIWSRRRPRVWQTTTRHRATSAAAVRDVVAFSYTQSPHRSIPAGHASLYFLGAIARRRLGREQTREGSTVYRPPSFSSPPLTMGFPKVYLAPVLDHLATWGSCPLLHLDLVSDLELFWSQSCPIQLSISVPAVTLLAACAANRFWVVAVL
jgi:hypothetical protein